VGTESAAHVPRTAATTPVEHVSPRHLYPLRFRTGMTDENEPGFEDEGIYWLGSRRELQAWKKYKKAKVLALVERGYSVEWYPDADGHIEVFIPERPQVSAPEYRAGAKFFSAPSEYGLNGGKISKLFVTRTTSNLIAKIVRGEFDKVDVLYNYDRGPDVDRLKKSSPEARRLYRDVLEELN
jgi:hypothetical protein